MKVVLRRHAPTEWNLESKYLGHTDQPLAPEGVRLAKTVPGDATAARVYTSTLARTRETAAIIYPRAAIVPRRDLMEMNFGVFEGRSSRELENDPEYIAWLDSNCESPCPGGECKRDFTARCRAAFLEILGREVRNGGTTLHILVHGGVIMAILSGFTFPEREYFAWNTAYCGGYELEFVDSGGDKPLRLVRELTADEGTEPA